MSVKVRLKMKSCHFICEIQPKQDFYLFQYKIAELVSQLPNVFIVYILREKAKESKMFFYANA